MVSNISCQYGSSVFVRLTFGLPIRMSLHMSVCISVNLYVCVSVGMYMSVCISVYLPVCFCLYFCLPVCVPVRVSVLIFIFLVCASVCLCLCVHMTGVLNNWNYDCLSVGLSVYLSVYMLICWYEYVEQSMPACLYCRYWMTSGCQHVDELSNYLSVFPTACLSGCLFVYRICLSVPVILNVCWHVWLLIWLSAYLHLHI